jgi:SAM-dependent methyltransferase
MWHSLAKSFLSFFYTQTDINGLLARGSMFVFSKEQFRYLLDKAGVSKAPISQEFKLGDALMDLGAGDGAPTQQLSTFFSQTDVTETSWSMRNILTRKGFNVLEVESWTDNRTEFYDMISCLNLLDRCERPATVLSQVRGALKPGGLLLVALVLPFRPFVEFGASRKPVEALPIAGETFESQAVSVVKFFESEHFRLMSWTRVPYLCEGDLAQSVYVLDDGLFLFSKTEPSSEESQQKDST